MVIITNKNEPIVASTKNGVFTVRIVPGNRSGNPASLTKLIQALSDRLASLSGPFRS